MAKLSSSSCRPLLQGMMLLALLLLASIQAVQAQGALEELMGAVGEKMGAVGEELQDKAPTVANTVLNKLRKNPELKDASDGAKGAIKVHKVYKNLCKAQGWMDKQNPGGASGSPSFVPCSSPPQVPAAAGTGASTLVPSSRSTRNDVRITGIPVDQEEVPVQTP